jgi:galactokinase
VNKKEDDWANYPKGTIWALDQMGYTINQGMDVLYYGTIPNQFGLSSSASIEVLTCYLLKELHQLDISLQQIALVSQFAENKFIGVSCGIMDQFAIAMGKADHAIFLDTSNLAFEYAPIKLADAKIVIACSNKKRGLGDSKYNERRHECEEALKDLQTVVKIQALGELMEEEFEANKNVIKNPIHAKRAKHAVYENQRTIKAIEALKEGKIKEFGQMMNASHVSLRDDYEVTGIELDTLVETAWNLPGVIGSRMTGAGFGGCTVSIVENDKVDLFIQEVGKTYEAKIGYKADFYIVDIGNGPCALA